MVNTTFTKDDILTVNKFAKKYNLDPQKALEVAAHLYRRNKRVPASEYKTQPAVVIQNKATHRSDDFKIHPLGAQIFLDEYKKRM